MKRQLVFLTCVIFVHIAAGPLKSQLTDPSLWNIQNDANGSATLTSVTDGNVGLKLSANFSNGQWSEINGYFRAKDLTGGDVIGFWYKATGGKPQYNLKVALSSMEKVVVAQLTNDNQWHQVFQPLSLWTNSPSFFSNVINLKFVLAVSSSVPGSGTLILDHCALYSNISSPIYIRTLDGMESSSFHAGWANYQDKANTVKLSTVPGLYGNALKMEYSFIDGTWIALVKDQFLNLNTADYLQFRFKSTGPVNHLSLRLSDMKDWQNVSVTYARDFYNLVGATPDWVTLRVHPQDLYFLSSVDPAKRMSLNITQISKIAFRIIRKNNAPSGQVLLSDLVWGNKTTSAEILPGEHPVFKSMTLDYNPISPDDDGWQDKVTFKYTLSKTAQVKLFIYDLRGVRIREIDLGKQVPGSETTAIWDALDKDGKKVKNGIYPFSIRASSDSGADSINGAEGVVR
jgi:hypothetical protein